jgi:hypothetical protein
LMEGNFIENLNENKFKMNQPIHFVLFILS